MRLNATEDHKKTTYVLLVVPQVRVRSLGGHLNPIRNWTPAQAVLREIASSSSQRASRRRSVVVMGVELIASLVDPSLLAFISALAPPNLWRPTSTTKNDVLALHTTVVL